MAIESSSNPIQKDIDHLAAAIRSPFTDEEEKRLARHRLRTIRECLRASRRLEAIVSSLHLRGVFSTLPDTELAKLVSMEHHGFSRLVTRGMARARWEQDIHAKCFSRGGGSPELKFSFDDYHRAVRHELSEEFARRQNERETEEGRRVRELLVEEEDRDKNLQSLAQRISRGLFIPGDRENGRRDAQSEAASQLWGNVKAYIDEAPRATAGTLLAYLKGAFNKTLETARAAVRNEIRTERRRRALVEYNSEQVELRLKGAGEPDPGHESVKRKILLEQMFVKGKLSRDEMDLIIECCIRARSQETVAQELGLSQATVSRNLQGALNKLSRVCIAPPNEKSL